MAQDLGTGHDALSALKSGIWSNSTCEVCWENPNANNATERNWVRQAIAKTWEKESALKFTGWGTCNSNSKGIRILIDDSWPHTKGLGKQLDGKANGMVLNFLFKTNCLCGDTKPSPCNNNNGIWDGFCGYNRQQSIESIAVHEFGHAIGIGHEQNRTDCAFCDWEKPQGESGDWQITPCDLEVV